MRGGKKSHINYHNMASTGGFTFGYFENVCCLFTSITGVMEGERKRGSKRKRL